MSAHHPVTQVSESNWQLTIHYRPDCGSQRSLKINICWHHWYTLSQDSVHPNEFYAQHINGTHFLVSTVHLCFHFGFLKLTLLHACFLNLFTYLFRFYNVVGQNSFKIKLFLFTAETNKTIRHPKIQPLCELWFLSVTYLSRRISFIKIDKYSFFSDCFLEELCCLFIFFLRTLNEMYEFK